MRKKQKPKITLEEIRQIERELKHGPDITSKTSITHHRTTKFALNKEPSK